MDIPQFYLFTYCSIFGLFPVFLASANKAALIFLWTYVSISLGVEQLGHMVGVYLIFFLSSFLIESTQCFPEWLYHLQSHHQWTKVPGAPDPSQHFGAVNFEQRELTVIKYPLGARSSNIPLKPSNCDVITAHLQAKKLRLKEIK